MKTLFLILFSFSAFGARETSVKIELSDYDVISALESEYPDPDMAYRIAYQKCGNTKPLEPESIDQFDDYSDHIEEHKGYEVINMYVSFGRMPYYYKCNKTI